jgi:hypothetical protein
MFKRLFHTASVLEKKAKPVAVAAVKAASTKPAQPEAVETKPKAQAPQWVHKSPWVPGDKPADKPRSHFGVYPPTAP